MGDTFRLLSRRGFLRMALGVLGTTFATGVYARYVEPRWVSYVHVDMPLDNLPARLEGATLVQLSDLHIGNRFDWGYIIEAFERMRGMAPELVVYTGDFVTFESDDQFEQLAAVLESAPLGRLGTVAVLGNHDYGWMWSDQRVAARVAELLSAAGITVLRNQLATIAGVQFVGLDDLWGPNFEPAQVMEQLAARRPAVVLVHNPDAADVPIWRGYQGWILCGHTHGGQVKPPFLPPPMLPVRNPRYAAGLIHLDDGRRMYVNRALGCLWQVRFNVRPEVTLFTLRKAG